MNMLKNAHRDGLFSNEKAKNQFGHVYVIEMSDGSVKIGKSIKPAERIRAISSGNQRSVVSSYISEKTICFGRVERLAHSYFSDCRIGGEFFDCNFKHAVSVVKSMSNFSYVKVSDVNFCHDEIELNTASMSVGKEPVVIDGVKAYHKDAWLEAYGLEF